MGKKISGAQKRKKKREKGRERARRGYGEVEAWTDGVMDRVGFAS